MQAEGQRQMLLVGDCEQVVPFSRVQKTEIFEPRTVESKRLQQYPVKLPQKSNLSAN